MSHGISSERWYGSRTVAIQTASGSANLKNRFPGMMEFEQIRNFPRAYERNKFTAKRVKRLAGKYRN